MDDIISRQTAIEALKICDNNEDGKICHICPMRDERWDGAWEDNETICYKKLMRDSAKLLAMPSEQPDHIGEVTEMVGDAVSRQGVLRLLNAVPSEEFATKAMLISGVNALPPAQPEYERVSAEDVAVSIAPTKLASAVWLYGTLTELEKAGYVICRRMT